MFPCHCTLKDLHINILGWAVWLFCCWIRIVGKKGLVSDFEIVWRSGSDYS